MGLFKNRKFALLVTIIVVIAATLISVNKSLVRLSREAEAMFYDGVYLESGGYRQPGLAAQLDKHAEASLGLATILINYPMLHDNAQVVIEWRRSMVESESISGKSNAYRMLSGYVYSLLKAASDIDITDRDQAAIDSYSATIVGAEEFIRASEYNRAASERWDERSNITRLIGRVLSAAPPEMF
ncbi:MAG: hypothetical protein FWH33_08390 [Oscillospiraceae bacterium]|nr:hypothetical protein [Oscillospiraceae bacterium]